MTRITAARSYHVIEDLRPNIYDPVEGTTIAATEVERVQRLTQLVNVRWTTCSGENIIISMTVASWRSIPTRNATSPELNQKLYMGEQDSIGAYPLAYTASVVSNVSLMPTLALLKT